MGGDLQAAKTDYSHGIYAQTARDIFHCLSLPQYRSSIEIFVTTYTYIFVYSCMFFMHIGINTIVNTIYRIVTK